MSRHLWVPRTHSARAQDVRASAPRRPEGPSSPAPRSAGGQRAAAVLRGPGKAEGLVPAARPGTRGREARPAGRQPGRGWEGREAAERRRREWRRLGAASGGGRCAAAQPAGSTGFAARDQQPPPPAGSHPLAASQSPAPGRCRRGTGAAWGWASLRGLALTCPAGLRGPGPLLEGRPAPPAPSHLPPPPDGRPAGAAPSQTPGSAAPLARRRQRRAAPRGEGAFKETHTHLPVPSARAERGSRHLGGGEMSCAGGAGGGLARLESADLGAWRDSRL